ncbi:hypothetical protein [Larkinella terrae]|uniref:Uncharacterized protein n=1 Tax=Larkinella terrae TaxID=2025311 RepID=A0A7K0EJR4_9BACT|nr:hypothetical protein [Larkinella terrae]MRS61678.1 hypothetical protein [Larkinella terrae]
MQAILNDTQTGSEFSHLILMAECDGFSVSEHLPEHRHLIMYRGTHDTDHFIYAVGYSNPEHIDLRTIKYKKEYSRQPISTEVDKVSRLLLFIGSVDPTDETAIAAILQATVGRF